MYLGNSKKTQYHCEKAQKALASQGFLDVAFFMALKKLEREEVRMQETHKSANLDVHIASMHKVNQHHHCCSRSGVPSKTLGTTILAVPGVLAEEEEEEEEEDSPLELLVGANQGPDPCEVNWSGRGSMHSVA